MRDVKKKHLKCTVYGLKCIWHVVTVGRSQATSDTWHIVALSVDMYGCLCMSVIKVVIVNNDQSIRCFVFLHKIEWVSMVLRILNLESHQNCMICLKAMTDDFFFYKNCLKSFKKCQKLKILPRPATLPPPPETLSRGITGMRNVACCQLSLCWTWGVYFLR